MPRITVDGPSNWRDAFLPHPGLAVTPENYELLLAEAEPEAAEPAPEPEAAEPGDEPADPAAPRAAPRPAPRPAGGDG